MICSVCKKNKEKVTPKNSDLMPSIRLFLCNDCLDNKYEPRYIIIMVGRGGDMKSIRPYVKEHRYVGDKITADQLMV